MIQVQGEFEPKSYLGTLKIVGSTWHALEYANLFLLQSLLVQFSGAVDDDDDDDD